MPHSTVPQGDYIPKRAQELIAGWLQLYERNLRDNLHNMELSLAQDRAAIAQEENEERKKSYMSELESRFAIMHASAQIAALNQTLGMVAERVAGDESDHLVTKSMSEQVARRYHDVVDERLIPSIAAKKMLAEWEFTDDRDGRIKPFNDEYYVGYAYLYPEYQREERKRRLEKYITMMESLENKYDHGKIAPPSEEARPRNVQ